MAAMASEPYQVGHVARGVAIFLLMLCGLISTAGAQEISQKIATGELNEFDLSMFCGGRDSGPFPRSRFGYATLG